MTAATWRKPIPPVTCTPWCTYGDGHTYELMAEDQSCFTVDAHIPASLHDPVEMDDGTTGPEWVSVYGQAWHHGIAPEIHLAQDEDAGMRLTVNEAREVAAALIAAADLIEGGEVPMSDARVGARVRRNMPGLVRLLEAEAREGGQSD